MAITRASFTICLLLSLATLATADYYSPSSPPVYKSPPVYTKPILPPPVYMPTLSPPVYTKPATPPPVYTPTLSPPVYTKPTIPPPVYTPTFSPPVYTKPTIPPPVYTSTVSPPVYKKSPSYSPPPPYVPIPTYSPPTKPYVPYVPKPTYEPPTKPYVPEILKAVDGIILCKNGYETYPILGARVKIECTEPSYYGKSEKVVVIYSDPTNYKGYFYLSLKNIKDITQCRVKLYTSPVETCNIPTSVNKGLTGIPLSLYGYHYHSDKNLNLFSLSPFYFTGPKAASTPSKY